MAVRAPVSSVERHFTTSELAALLAVHPETIRRAAAAGASGRGASDVIDPESAVKAWLESLNDERAA